MKLVVKYLKPFGFALLIGFIIKVAGTLVELALPYILSHMLDHVVKDNAPTGNLTPIFIWGGIMILCATAALVLNIVANRMAARVAKNAAEAARHFARLVSNEVLREECRKRMKEQLLKYGDYDAHYNAIKEYLKLIASK